MKKISALLLSVMLLSTLILSGCNQPNETTVSEEVTPTQTDATTTKAETEPAPAETKPSIPDIDLDNLLKVAELYSAKEPEGKFFVPVYSDGIRGSASYFATADKLYFGYSSVNGASSLELRFERATRSVELTFDLPYGKTRFYGVGYAGINDIETLIDEVAEGKTDRCEMYDSSALSKYAEKIKNDLPILYSRLITLSDNAFPELGLGLKDIGIVLGEKYRATDPKQATSIEPVVTKTLTYKNGYNSSKKKLWTEYYYNAIGKLTNTKSGKWHSVYGQQSSSMLDPSDYVQYSSSNKSSGQLYYRHSMREDQNNDCESCTIDILKKNKKSLYTSIYYEFEQKMYPIGRGVVGYKYIYMVRISAKPGQYNKVFASKEDLKKYATVELTVFNSKGVGKNAWTKKADIEKLKKNFESDGCTYYTKDEIIDKFWDRHEAILTSLDNGMVWLDTNLADIGINWK